MRRVYIIIPLILIFFLVLFTPILAQDNHTAREEREGRTIWDRLQQKKVTCEKLSDEDFERLGEYYMGQMAGNAHEAMNKMMIRMMGEKGEEQMHGVMGKRFSGCDREGGDRSVMGYGGLNNMMGWGGFGFFGLLFWLFWIVVLIDLILLGIWLWKKIKKEK